MSAVTLTAAVLVIAATSSARRSRRNGARRGMVWPGSRRASSSMSLTSSVARVAAMLISSSDRTNSSLARDRSSVWLELARMTASGVRSSCAAFARNARCCSCARRAGRNAQPAMSYDSAPVNAMRATARLQSHSRHKLVWSRSGCSPCAAAITSCEFGRRWP